MALSTFAGGRLWGARYGTARPWVLALHGWGRDHHDFDAVLGGLDAVALDLPGHGVAPEPPEAWSTRQYAEWVAPVMADLGGGPWVVLGHSFGARVAVHLAAASGGTPEDAPCIGALVLTGAPLAPPPGEHPSRPSLAYRTWRALHRARLVSDERLEQLRRQHGSDDYRRASPVMRGVLVKAVSETASAAYIPPLRQWAEGGGALELVWWESDTEASLDGVLAGLNGHTSPQASAHATPKVTRVPGAGHLIRSEMVGEVRAALMRHQPAY
jgi:pimeloyl-ACP methyl ester carboxylesterase